MAVAYGSGVHPMEQAWAFREGRVPLSALSPQARQIVRGDTMPTLAPPMEPPPMSLPPPPGRMPASIGPPAMTGYPLTPQYGMYAGEVGRFRALNEAARNRPPTPPPSAYENRYLGGDVRHYSAGGMPGSEGYASPRPSAMRYASPIEQERAITAGLARKSAYSGRSVDPERLATAKRNLAAGGAGRDDARERYMRSDLVQGRQTSRKLRLDARREKMQAHIAERQRQQQLWMARLAEARARGMM